MTAVTIEEYLLITGGAALKEKSTYKEASNNRFCCRPKRSYYTIIRQKKNIDTHRENMYIIAVHVNGGEMSILTTYTAARAQFKKLCDEVSSTREPVIIQRRNGEDVALVSADELESLMETAHLLKSQKNATRLISALVRAQSKEGKPSSVEKLRRELGIE